MERSICRGESDIKFRGNQEPIHAAYQLIGLGETDMKSEQVIGNGIPPGIRYGFSPFCPLFRRLEYEHEPAAEFVQIIYYFFCQHDPHGTVPIVAAGVHPLSP